MELGENIGNWGEGHIYYYFLKKIGTIWNADFKGNEQ